MGALQRRDDAFNCCLKPCMAWSSVQKVYSRRPSAQPGVLGPTQRSPVARWCCGSRDLPSSSCQDRLLVPGKCRGVQLGVGGRLHRRWRSPARLDDRAYLVMIEEGMENADGVAAAADAGDDGVEQRPGPSGLSVIWLRLAANRRLVRAPAAIRVGVRPSTLPNR